MLENNSSKRISRHKQIERKKSVGLSEIESEFFKAQN